MDTNTLKKDIEDLKEDLGGFREEVRKTRTAIIRLEESAEEVAESLNRVNWFFGYVSDDLGRLGGDLEGEGREPYESGAEKTIDVLRKRNRDLENAFAEIQEKIQEVIDLNSESMMVEGEPEKYYDKASAHMAGMAEALDIVREALKKTE